MTVSATTANSFAARLGGSRARTRVGIAALLGVAVGVALGVAVSATVGPLVGWVVAALVFCAWTWTTVWPQTAAQTRADARRDDPSRVTADIACLGAAVASLVAVAVVLVDAGNAKGATRLLDILLAVVAVVASWLLVHTIFALKYARLYYAEHKGISFNEDDDPQYSDFAYIAFTIGMTFQVSDTDLQTKDMRRLALRHMLLAYLMGAVFVAITINLVAGMTK
jgi:uncharacterized membrane protein